jgi:hypothetical protein
VISGLAALVLAMSAFLKLKGGPELIQGMAQLGLPESMILPLAILEMSCVVIYLLPATSISDAILLTGYIGGAICTHQFQGESACRFDYLPVESTGISEPLPVAEPRLGRRTVLTLPLFPPPQKN